MNNVLTKVRPVLPVAPYVGGKRLLADELVKRINAVPHVLYAEPFVGMGGVFLRRDHAPSGEVMNDKSRDVATLFRMLQRHYGALMDMLRYQLTSRAEFDRLMASDPSTLTDLERAARFLYLQRVAFGGKVDGRNFGVKYSGGARFNVSRLEPLLEAVAERLHGVIIECLDWREFIDRYDRAGTLFYLDPPYYGVEHYYGRGLFERADFEVMADKLRGIKGRCILSLNDTPEVRQIFKGLKIERVALRYTICGSDKDKQASEVIISN